jgi:hypothetical protein
MSITDQKKEGSQSKDIKGQKFGKLLAMEFDGVRNKRAYWKCVCDCGTVMSVAGKSLRTGNTKSCGCVGKKRIGNLNKLPKGESSFNQLYQNYILSAKKRCVDFNIDKTLFKRLTSSSCFYCGDQPSQVTTNGSGCNGHYIYNGIDRVNNDIGYTQDNVVPCCKHCNTMKMTLPVDVFLTKITKIYFRMVANGDN